MNGMCRKKSRGINEFVVRGLYWKFVGVNLHSKTFAVDDSDFVGDNRNGFCHQSDCARRPAGPGYRA